MYDARLELLAQAEGFYQRWQVLKVTPDAGAAAGHRFSLDTIFRVSMCGCAMRPNDRTFQPPAPTMPALSSDGCARVGCNVLLGGDSLGREARCR